MEPQAVQNKFTPVGIAGLVVALLALMGAVLSPWVLDALDPKPIDEVAVEVAGRIKDRLVARAKGQPYVAPAESRGFSASHWYTGGVVAAGALAVCIGVIGLVCHHNARLNCASVAVGASAIVFQYMLILAAALLLILLVGLVLSAMAGGT